MALTARQLMGIFSPPPLDVDHNATASRKAWTEDFEPFHREYVNIWQPQITEIETFLGPGTWMSEADHVGLSTPAHNLNILPQLIKSEGDVSRDFYQNILPPVSLAFSGESAMSSRGPGTQPVSGAPKLWPRSLVGTTRSNSKIVDFQMTMAHQQPSLEAAAAIGEMKNSRVIRRSEWTFDSEADGLTIRLQQELRGYAPFPTT
jgi:hypothetical protein